MLSFDETTLLSFLEMELTKTHTHWSSMIMGLILHPEEMLYNGILN